jgi:hypothetical protein
MSVKTFIALLLLCNSGTVLAETVSCTQVELPNVVATLAAGDTIFVGSFSHRGKSSPATIVLDDIDGDAIPELGVETDYEEVSWWNLDGSPCLKCDHIKQANSNAALGGSPLPPGFPGVPSMKSGWPVTGMGRIVGGTVLADLNGDGDLEVIVGAADNYVHVWDAAGNPLPGWPQLTSGDVFDTPAVGDIDGDGEPEVVVGCAGDSVYAWHADGSPVAGSWPVPVNGDIEVSPTLLNCDQDTALEVVIGCFRSEKEGRISAGSLYIIDSDGSILPGWPVDFSEDVYSTASVADINCDGNIDIVIGTSFSTYGFVYVFNIADASVLPGWPQQVDGYIIETAVGDIDNDGKPEIVLGTSWWGGSIWAFKGDGSVMPGWPVDVHNNVTNSPALVDFDGDHKFEIVVATNISAGSAWYASLIVFDYLGNFVDNWPVFFTVGDEYSAATPVAGDIDADGELEIIACTKCPLDPSPQSDIYAYNYDATLVNEAWPWQGDDIVGSPALADIDNDSQLELAVGTWSEGELCLQLGEYTAPASLPWPMYGHDIWHTGYTYEYVCGDADGNAMVNISDAVYLISFIFGGGTAPVPLNLGDADCNLIVNISDAVYLISYIFGGGSAPCAECP